MRHKNIFIFNVNIIGAKVDKIYLITSNIMAKKKCINHEGISNINTKYMKMCQAENIRK